MFASKGYLYSKIFIYLIKEDSEFTSKSLENKILLELIKLRIKYKIQLLVLLTHSDTYCKKVKDEDDNKWKETCKKKINNNKDNLLKYLNSEIKKDNINNFPMQENDILHICLAEYSDNELKDEDILKEFNEEDLEEYNNGDEKTKKILIKFYRKGKNSNKNGIKMFLENEMKILEQKELTREMKRRLPSQYHMAFKS